MGNVSFSIRFNVIFIHCCCQFLFFCLLTINRLIKKIKKSLEGELCVGGADIPIVSNDIIFHSLIPHAISLINFYHATHIQSPTIHSSSFKQFYYSNVFTGTYISTIKTRLACMGGGFVVLLTVPLHLILCCHCLIHLSYYSYRKTSNPFIV